MALSKEQMIEIVLGLQLDNQMGEFVKCLAETVKTSVDDITQDLNENTTDPIAQEVYQAIAQLESAANSLKQLCI